MSLTLASPQTASSPPAIDLWIGKRMTFGEYIQLSAENPEHDLMQLITAYSIEHQADLEELAIKLGNLAAFLKQLRDKYAIPTPEDSTTEHILALAEFTPADWLALMNMELVQGLRYVALRSIALELRNRELESQKNG